MDFKRLKLLPLVFVLLFLDGCDPCRNVDFYFLDENAHSFRLFDYYSKEPLFGLYSQFIRSEVRIVDGDGKVYFGGPVRSDGLIYFELLTNEDQGKLDQKTVRELYLILDENDTDTLRYEFEMKLDECGNQVYHHVKLTYNDSIYIDELNDRFPYRELYKK